MPVNKSCIARIHRSDGSIVGAGFLISQTHIVTCAHVALAALGLPETEPLPILEPIQVEFLGDKKSQSCNAEILSGSFHFQNGDDIALLKLETNPPPWVQPSELKQLDDYTDRSFRTYGFPKGFDNGVAATGRCVDEQLKTRWIQLEDIKVPGQTIIEGFSGAPVWDDKTQTIIGMISAYDRQTIHKTAFMIPNSLLLDAISNANHTDKDASWRERIPDESLNIVDHPARMLRVIAGPGTGKTYSLIRRVARLLDEGVDPRTILLVTFTRTAANDLSRALTDLNIQGVNLIRSGTLHSFCLSMLRKDHVLSHIGRSSKRILLDYEKEFLLRDLRNQPDQPQFGDVREREKRLKAFEADWAREQHQEPGWSPNAIDREFGDALKRWLRFHNALLMEEVVPETLRYLRDNPACDERNLFSHVLVDEFQDLNKAEQNLIDLLTGSGTLSIIGDPDQSIYEDFRYAHPEGIEHFDASHQGTHTLQLTTCQRCPSTVLSMAKTLIAHNSSRNRILNPKPDNIGGEVHIVQWQNMEVEAIGLANFIRTRIQRGDFKLGEVLVLCPRRQFGYLIKQQLTAYGLPAHSFFYEDEFKGSPTNTPPAQEAFTLLLLHANRQDKVALRCWLGFGNQNLNTDQYTALYDYCYYSGITPLSALEGFVGGTVSIPNISPRSKLLRERYKLLIERLLVLEAKSPRQVFDTLFPNGEEWADPFRLFAEELTDESDISDYITKIRIGVTQPELPTEVDYIRIMSLHKSKGLSADHVIIPGCVEGLIPTFKEDIESERHLQEQRRLFYVALTRSRKTLVISSVLNVKTKDAHSMGAQIIQNHGQVVRTISSRFLAELGSDAPRPVSGNTWVY